MLGLEAFTQRNTHRGNTSKDPGLLRSCHFEVSIHLRAGTRETGVTIVGSNYGLSPEVSQN